MEFDISAPVPASLLEKINKILNEGKEENPERSPLQEKTAPGEESWVKKNKSRFEKQYGTKKGKEVLYAKAWKMSKNEETEHDKKKVAVSPRHKDDSKVLLEKGKKKQYKLEEDKEKPVGKKKQEKIIINPEVHPDRIDSTESGKPQKTV